MVEVAAGVYAYLQPDGGWCLNNAGVIRSGCQVAIVDTAATEKRARLLRDQVARIEPTPPRYVINTHFHGDHTFGNYLFPEAAVIAQRQTRADMVMSGLHLQSLWPHVEWGAVELAPPTILFHERMVLHVGDIRMELLNVGPAHTTADTVVWLPEERVLFTGDIVMSGVTPFLPMGTVSGSLVAVDRLRGLNPRVVVTGHGVLSGIEVFDEVGAYLRWLQGLAREGMAAGVSPIEVARQATLGEFGRWLDVERLVANLHRAYADELGDAPSSGVDIIAAFGEMVDFHGGPLRCLA
jgi:cyclase